MKQQPLRKLGDLLLYVLKLNLCLPWKVLVVGSLVSLAAAGVDADLLTLSPHGALFAVFCFSLKATFLEFQRVTQEGSRMYLECRQLFRCLRRNLEGSEDLETGDHPRVGFPWASPILEDDSFEQEVATTRNNNNSSNYNYNYSSSGGKKRSLCTL